ncbi:MAG: right-handed parallel beta-helix repeat-containing protein, partial [Methanobacteriota archaeon]
MKSSRTIAMLVVIALMLSAGCFVEVPSEKPVSRPKAVCPRPVQPIQMEPMSDPDEFDDQGPYMDLEPNIIVPTDYPSIQEAEDNSCVGDVILVRPGTYLESVTIDTEGLYLLGEGSSMTRIVSPLGPAVRIAADGVSVNSVGMEGGGVLMDHVIGAYLISSSVSNTMVGATLIGTTESHVMGTTFQSVQVGIKIGSMSNDNEIGPSNSLSQLNVGITVEGDSRNNEIFQNRLTQAGMGILVDQSPNNLLHHNTFSDIGGFAVEIHGGSDTTVLSGNEAWDVMGGFSVDDTNDVTLIGNAMSATGDSVILHNVVKASLRNNSLLSSVHAALLIESGTQDVTVEDNVFRASPFGIQADGVVGLRVEGNQFGGGEVGLEVTSGGSPTIVDNRFSHQSRASLRLLSSPSATVSDNQFLKGLDWSIEAIGSTDIKIQGNSILSHQDGIFLENANDATIENNEVKSSGTGIQITTSPGTGVSGNTLARNDVGVELQSNGVSLHHNWLADNLLQVGQSMIGQNSWDDGSGHGNFWSDYDGEDLDYDGVGDTLIPHLGVDSFPLMKEDFDSFQIFIDLVEEARSKILASGIHHGIQN